MAMLVTVGGTGQHVALAAMRLKLLGALPQDLDLLAIDASDESRVSISLKSPWKGMTEGDRHPMRLQGIEPPFSAGGSSDVTFKGMFDSGLLDGFFNEEEAKTKVSDGMFGRPAIGASVAAGAFDGKIGSRLGGLAHRTFFVAGSVVGGTGAGVMHRILQELANGKDRKVFGLFLLRWFDLPPDGQINASVMARNEQLGLRFLLDTTVDYMTAGVVVGPPEKPVGITTTQMATGDGEIVSVYPLMACLALLGIEGAVVNQSDRSVWTLIHDESRETWMLDHPWDGGVSLRKRYFWAIHTKLMLQFLLASHEKGTLHSAIYGWLGGGAAAVTDGLYHSVKEHIGTSNRDGEVGLAAMAAQWKSYVARIDFCCDWVRALFPALSQNEDCAAGIRTRLEAAPRDLHKADFFNTPLRVYFRQGVPRGDRAFNAAELADELTKLIVAGTQGEFQ